MGEVSGEGLLLERTKRGVDISDRLRERWRTCVSHPHRPSPLASGHFPRFTGEELER